MNKYNIFVFGDLSKVLVAVKSINVALLRHLLDSETGVVIQAWSIQVFFLYASTKYMPFYCQLIIKYKLRSQVDIG